MNRGFDAAAVTKPVNEIPNMRRPDAVKLVLQEVGTAKAPDIADLQAARRAVQIATEAENPPGARLHVLTIGISDYGDKARDLTLKFAASDAQDVANALNKQGGGLYAAPVKLDYLLDHDADKGGIFEALHDMARRMARDAGQDLAVVMFSGHGVMIDDQFYLVPYGVNSSTDSHLEADALPATQFQAKIREVAKYGRVLVLLDACRSARLISGLSAEKSGLVAGNVTVLTSSTADTDSREDEKWGHGAFTKILLDALSGSGDVDTDHNGAISVKELTDYIEDHLPKLTEGAQHLGHDVHFSGDIFLPGR
jgi:uncharacterized caspase-like protein